MQEMRFHGAKIVQKDQMETVGHHILDFSQAKAKNFGCEYFIVGTCCKCQSALREKVVLNPAWDRAKRNQVILETRMKIVERATTDCPADKQHKVDGADPGTDKRPEPNALETSTPPVVLHTKSDTEKTQ
jgi:hypothetical protein